MNDITRRAIKQTHVPLPVVKGPVSLTLEDNKRPGGTTLLPWAKGKPLAWDITVPDTYAESHIGNTLTIAGATAHQATQHKITKYSKLASVGVQVKLWNPLRTRAIPERFCRDDSLRRGTRYIKCMHLLPYLYCQQTDTKCPSFESAIIA